MAETARDIFDSAVEEVSASGDLSLPTRRRLWLALGELEWRDEDDRQETPRALTEPLKKRAGLAWACAKKVMPVWSAYAPEDKAPQKLLKTVRSYLDGRVPAETLDKAMEDTGDFLDRAENEPYSTAPAAAMAVRQAAWAAWWDELLLDPRYDGADDGDLDYDDWDAAYLAAVAWSGRDEESQPGERAVQWMRFWAWYLEQLAPLLGMERFRFPQKAIRLFAEKQAPKKPVPAEVTMESFCDYIGAGDYLYHTRNGHSCEIVTRMRGDHAVCPKTKQACRELKFYYSVALLSAGISGVSLEVTTWVPLFHCPEHPGNSHTPRPEYGNAKADCKRFLTGAGREEAFLRQVKERAANAFVIGEGYTKLNGETEHHHNVRIPAGVPGIRWADRSTETLEIDLAKFGPHVYFPDCDWEDLRRLYPAKAVPQEDGGFLLEYQRHWVRCYLDDAGALCRVTLTSRFKVEVDWYDPGNQNQEKYNPGKKIGWVKALKEAFDLSTAEARAWVEDPGQPWRERFTGLTRRQAEDLQTCLRAHGIKCRIIPWRVGVPGDTVLR